MPIDASAELAEGEAPLVFKRASFIGKNADGSCVILRENGKEETVPLTALRRTRRPEETDGLVEKATIMALYGEWLPGVVNEISDEATIDDAARIGAQIRIGNKLVSTTLSRRSVVGLDAGDPATMGKLKRGSQMVVRHEDSWVSALLIKLPEDPSAPDAVYYDDCRRRRGQACGQRIARTYW